MDRGLIHFFNWDSLLGPRVWMASLSKSWSKPFGGWVSLSFLNMKSSLKLSNSPSNYVFPIINETIRPVSSIGEEVTHSDEVLVHIGPFFSI